MTFVRRHLASLGLLVAALHVTVLAVGAAALCCGKVPSRARTAADAHHHCSERAEPGHVCPMHRAKRASESTSQSVRFSCRAQLPIDNQNLFISLSDTDMPPQAVVSEPARAEIGAVAPVGVEPLPVDPPPGPPPRA